MDLVISEFAANGWSGFDGSLGSIFSSVGRKATERLYRWGVRADGCDVLEGRLYTVVHARVYVRVTDFQVLGFGFFVHS